MAAARFAKEEHARAISSSVVPAMMKRAEAALAEDSLSMSDVPELVLQLSGGGDKQKEQAAAALANLAQPWMHANEAAAASGASPATTAASGASPARVLSPRVSAETEDIAIARGAGGRLGVDLDDDNRVRNVASGGCPPLSASLLFSLHSPSLPPLPP